MRNDIIPFLMTQVATSDKLKTEQLHDQRGHHVR